MILILLKANCLHIYEQFPSGKRVVTQAVKPVGSLHLLLAGQRESKVMKDTLWCSE